MTGLVSINRHSITQHLNVAVNYDYSKMLPIWQQAEDCYNGDVKRYAHRYIAPPAGTFDEKIVNNAQILKTIEALKIPIAEGSSWSSAAKSYALGGFEPDLMPKTLKGFKALAGEHSPIVKLSPQLEYLLENATKDGKTLDDFYLSVLHNVLLKGRAPILIDVDDSDGRLKFVQYKAEALQYWKTASTAVNLSDFEMSVLKDVIPKDDFDPIDNNNGDEFEDIYFKLSLANNQYIVSRYQDNRDGRNNAEIRVPRFKGKSIDFIPLIAIGSLDNTPNVDAVPLIGIANCVVQIYSLGCVLSHAETTSAIPTMYITGIEPSSAPDIAGAGVLYCLPEYTSKVGYTTTDTSSMAHIQSRMDDFYSQAQELGASLLGSNRQGSESGEALRLRQASSTTTLKSIVTNVGIGVQKALMMIAKWHGISEEQVFEPNTEFSTFALTANETVALVQSWQAGAISRSTLVENFRKAGMLKAGTNTEDELKLLDIPEEQYVEKCGCKPSGAAGRAQLETGENLPKSNTFNKAI